MKAIPDLVPLHDSRPGVRALVQVEIRGPSTLKDQVTALKRRDIPTVRENLNHLATLNVTLSGAPPMMGHRKPTRNRRSRSSKS